MSAPITIPRSSKSASASYGSALGSSPTPSVNMGSLSSYSSSPRSAGVYVPVHKRTASASPSASSRELPSEASTTPVSNPLPYTYSLATLLSLRPTAQAYNDKIKHQIRASLEPEVADMVLMSRKMRKGLEFRNMREGSPKPKAVAHATTAPPAPAATAPEPVVSTTLTTAPPLSTTTTSKNPPRRTRSSSTRTRPPRQMLRLSRNAARVMNAKESWRVSSIPAPISVS